MGTMNQLPADGPQTCYLREIHLNAEEARQLGLKDGRCKSYPRFVAGAEEDIAKAYQDGWDAGLVEYGKALREAPPAA